jgi:hypothetical protein
MFRVHILPISKRQFSLREERRSKFFSIIWFMLAKTPGEILFFRKLRKFKKWIKLILSVNSDSHITHINSRCLRKFWGKFSAAIQTTSSMETLKNLVITIFQLFTFILSKSLSKVCCFKKKIKCYCVCCFRRARKRSKLILGSDNKIYKVIKEREISNINNFKIIEDESMQIIKKDKN